MMCASKQTENHQKLGSDRPRVSIGMPVFNGEKYLEEALDSILGQTFTDFELIISDNASTDRTEEICHAYAAKDRRVRYYRNRKNLGAPENYNSTVKLARCEYFKWAAADDVHSPEYLKKCVEMLDNDPSFVLCHSKTARINDRGVLVGNYDHQMRIASPERRERFADIISIKTNPCWTVFGVMRKRILLKTPLHGNYRGADLNLLAELSLYGRLFEVPEYLFFRRDHPEAYTAKYSGKLSAGKILPDQMAWWSNSSWLNYSNFKNFWEFFNSIDRAPLKWSERLECYNEILKWIKREGWKMFGNDVQQYVLSPSSFGRSSVVVVKRLLRLIGLQISSIEW